MTLPNSVRREENIWPFSSTKPVERPELKSSWTVGRANEEAFKTGYKGTVNFGTWLKAKRLDDRSSGQIEQLRRSFREGVQKEHDEAVGRSRGRGGSSRGGDKYVSVGSDGKVVGEVASALENYGASRREARDAAREASKGGGGFDVVFKRAVSLLSKKSNPQSLTPKVIGQPIHMSGGNAENPKDPNADKYYKIAEDESEGKIDGWVKRRTYDGLAWIAEEGDKRIIEAPIPTTPTALYIFLHEVGHHQLGHLHQEASCKVEESGSEYEATMYSLNLLKKYEVPISDKLLGEAKWNVEHWIKKEKKAGCPVDKRAEEFVYGSSKTMNNPWWGRTKDAIKGERYAVLDSDNLPIHTRHLDGLTKTEALKMAKEARAAGEKVHLVPLSKLRSNPLGYGHWEEFESERAAKKFARLMEGQGKTVLVKGKFVRVDESNPARSGAQYRLAQAVLSGQSDRMPVSVARDIIDKTPARLRSQYSKQNPEPAAADMYDSFHGRPSEQLVTFTEDEHYHEYLAELGVCCGVLVEGVDGKCNAIGLSGYVWEEKGKEQGFVEGRELRGNPRRYRRNKKGPILSSWDQANQLLYGSVKGIDSALRKVLNSKRRRNPESDSVGPNTTLLCSNEDGTQIYAVGGDQSLDLEQLGITDDMATKELVTIGDVVKVYYETEKDFDDFEEIQYHHELGEETGDLPVLAYDRLNERLLFIGGAYKIDKPMFETSPGIEN